MVAHGEPEGHVVVLVLDKETGRAYIVDPSYSYVNGWAEMIEIEVVLRTGELDKKHLPPMSIHPHVKRAMLTQFASRIAYVNAYVYALEGVKVVSYEPRAEIGSPREVINMWKVVTNLSPVGYTVASSDFMRYFAYDEDLAAWIESKLGA